MSHEKDNIPIFPVSGWQAGPMPGYDFIALKFQYISSLLQPVDDAQETQFFGPSPLVTKNLISDLQRYLDELEKSSIQAPPVSRH